MARQFKSFWLLSLLTAMTLSSAGWLFAGLAQGAETPCETTPLTPAEEKLGKEIVEQRCAQCHKAHQPQEYTMSQWKGIVNRMGPKAALRQSDMTLLLKYIESERKKAKSHA